MPRRYTSDGSYEDGDEYYHDDASFRAHLDRTDELFRDEPRPMPPPIPREARSPDEAEMAAFAAIALGSGDGPGAIDVVNKLSGQRAAGGPLESLPVEGCEHEAIKLMGVELGEMRQQSNIFREAKFPEGWDQRTDFRADAEGRIKIVRDELQRWRIEVYHLNQFWDDYAACHPLPRYSARRDDHGEKTMTWHCFDAGTTLLHSVIRECPHKLYSDEWWALYKEVEAECQAWLTKYYPDWKDPLAYWSYPKTALERVATGA